MHASLQLIGQRGDAGGCQASKIVQHVGNQGLTTRILRLSSGEVWVKTDGPKQLEVETPVATAVVRETEFNMRVAPDGQSILTVVQGVVEFGTAFGTCPIRANTVSYGVRGKRCTPPAPTDVAPVLNWSRNLLK